MEERVIRWYALFVQSGKEEFVKQQIIRHNIECRFCIPKRKVPEKRKGCICHQTKLMFPGYVFIEANMDFKLYYSLKSSSNYMYSILNYLNKADLDFHHNHNNEEIFFKHIPDEEMSQILALINPVNDTMEYSLFNFNSGNMRIISGPLLGQEGRIRKIDRRKKRAKLAIEVLGQEKLIDVGFEVLNSEN